MGLVSQIKLCSLDSFKSGVAEFYTPQICHETMLVNVDAKATESLYVHHFQTDQLLVVRGSLIMVILQNREYQFIPLSEHCRQVLTVPPGIPHGVINPSNTPCVLVNSVLRHGPAHERDYRPLKLPLPYESAKLGAVMKELEASVAA